MAAEGIRLQGQAAAPSRSASHSSPTAPVGEALPFMSWLLGLQDSASAAQQPPSKSSQASPQCAADSTETAPEPGDLVAGLGAWPQPPQTEVSAEAVSPLSLEAQPSPAKRGALPPEPPQGLSPLLPSGPTDQNAGQGPSTVAAPALSPASVPAATDAADIQLPAQPQSAEKAAHQPQLQTQAHPEAKNTPLLQALDPEALSTQIQTSQAKAAQTPLAGLFGAAAPQAELPPLRMTQGAKSQNLGSAPVSQAAARSLDPRQLQAEPTLSEGASTVDVPLPAEAAPSPVLSTNSVAPAASMTEAPSLSLAVGAISAPGGAAAPQAPPGVMPSPQTAPLDVRQEGWTQGLAADLVQLQQQGGSRMRMILAPEQLGSLECTLIDGANGIELRIVTESPAARELLQQHGHELQSRFAQAGLSLGGFHCDSGPQSSPREQEEALTFSQPAAADDDSLTPAPTDSGHSAGLLNLYA